MTAISVVQSLRRSRRWPRKSILTCFLLVTYIMTLVSMHSLSTVPITNPSTQSASSLPMRARRLDHHNECPGRNNNVKDITIHQPPSIPGVKGKSCKYEGHCGVGTTCIAAIDGPGKTCQDYTSSSQTTDVTSNRCVRVCIAALTESLQNQGVVVQGVKKTTHNIPGCIVNYRRTIQRNETTDRPPDYYAKLVLNNQIVRIDPVLTTTASSEGEWMALCNDQCISTSDCSKESTCKEGICQRNEAYESAPIISNEEDRHEMVIVTGANQQYFYGLLNLAGSIRYWAPKHKLVVYNLGMTEENLKEVESWGNVLDIKWRDGMPKSLPDHLRLPKVYAWKPVALNESLHEYKQIMWLDAGSTVIAPIDNVIRITQQTGIFLVQGQDESMVLSHPCTYPALGPYSKDTFDGGPHYSGNTQAYLFPSRYVDTVVIPNAKCALEPECIMPTGSSLKNHRYDQTTLSILSYRHDLRIPEYSNYLAASRPRASLKDEHLNEAAAPIVWTSRGTCTDFYHQMVESPWQEHLGHIQFMRNRKRRTAKPRDLKASCLRVMSPEDCKKFSI